LRKAIPKSLPGTSITLIAMTEEGKAVVPGKELIPGLFAQTAAKNVKSRSSPAETVQYTARNVFRSAREAAARLKKRTTVSPEKVLLFKVAILIDNGTAETEALERRRNQSFDDEKNEFK